MFNYEKNQKQNQGGKMAKLSQAAQVAKNIKQVAKKYDMKVTASSQYFSMGNSVTVKVLTGSDDDVKKLKDYAAMYQYGSFDGMTDSYNSNNVRDDIPQTKYLSIDDERAQYIVKDLKGDKYDDYTWKVDGEKVRSWYQFADALKKVASNQVGFEWFSLLKNTVNDLNNSNTSGVAFPIHVGYGGKVFQVLKNKTNQEVALCN